MFFCSFDINWSIFQKFWAIELKAFSTNHSLVSPRSIQIQLISVARNSIYMTFFEYFFDETGI